MEQVKPFEELTPEELKEYARIGYELHLAQKVRDEENKTRAAKWLQTRAVPREDREDWPGDYWDAPAFVGRRP